MRGEHPGARLSDRPLYPHPAPLRGGGGLQDRGLCPAEKLQSGCGDQDGPSDLCGRQRCGRQLQLWLRHRYLQLRRLPQAPHHHWQQRVCGVQHQLCPSGGGGRRRLYRRGNHGDGGRSGGRHGNRALPPGGQARLGGGEPAQKGGNVRERPHKERRLREKNLGGCNS